jgi:hypothetical protein
VLAGWTSANPALTRVAEAIAAALDREARALPEPAYHNRHHMAEAVHAMALLCRTACDQRWLRPSLAELGVLAMIGHDLGHDGSLPSPGVLEARAAQSVEALAHRLPAAQRRTLTRIILATDPATVPANLARARDPAATGLDRLIALANEADVLASLLPDLGLTLSERLAEEWRPHDPGRADAACSFSGRRSFLTIYAAPSEAACQLGLQACIARQLQAITPELDAMPRPEAIARYRARLVD